MNFVVLLLNFFFHWLEFPSWIFISKEKHALDDQTVNAAVDGFSTRAVNIAK